MKIVLLFHKEEMTYYAACDLIYRKLIHLGNELVPLGSKYNILSGFAFKSEDYSIDGIRLLRNVNVKPGTIDWNDVVRYPEDKARSYRRFQLYPGDLCLSMDGTINKQGLKIAFLRESDTPSLLLQRVCKFIPKGKLSNQFLFHMLHTQDFFEHLDKSNRSIAIPHVSAKQLESFQIPGVDEDLDKQICSFLDAVNHGQPFGEWPKLTPNLDELRRIVARIEEVSFLVRDAQIINNQITDEISLLEASLLPNILPTEIQSSYLRDLVDTNKKISYGVLVPGPDTGDGVPFVRVQDLSIYCPSPIPNKKIATEVEAHYQRTRLNGGEVLVAVVGTIGKIGVAPESWKGANIARAVCRIVPGTKIDKWFLAEVLQTREIQDYLRECTRTLATTHSQC